MVFLKYKALMPFLLFGLLAPLPAFAQTDGGSGIVSAGKPAEARLETNPSNPYPDIFTRQFDYRQQDLKFNSLLRQRQSHYEIPGRAARSRYVKNLETLNESRADDHEGNP